MPYQVTCVASKHLRRLLEEVPYCVTWSGGKVIFTHSPKVAQWNLCLAKIKYHYFNQ